MKVPLENAENSKEIDLLIAKRMLLGDDPNDIAVEIKERFGINATGKMISYYWNKIKNKYADRDVVRKIIAEDVANGKSWSDIRADIEKVTGIEFSEAEVVDLYNKIISDVKKTVSSDSDLFGENDDFDLEQELRSMYYVQKRRIKKLMELESAAGMPFPETSKNVEIATKILERIALIRLKLGQADDPSVIIDKLLERMENE